MIHCLTDTAKLGPKAFYKVKTTSIIHKESVTHSEKSCAGILFFLSAGPCASRNPSDSSHCFNLHISGAASSVLWYSGHHLYVIFDPDVMFIPGVYILLAIPVVNGECLIQI